MYSPRHFKAKKSVCRFAPRSERFGNCLKGDRSDIEYVVSNSRFEFRQDGFQFGLSLGGNSAITKQTNAVF
jgi:hypothetical protein